MSMKNYSIPYGEREISIKLPQDQVIFTGEVSRCLPDPDWEIKLMDLLDHPTAGPSLASLIKEESHIVILVEDQTRHTPVKEILPHLIEYLQNKGVCLSQIEILICPGTHRILTEDELVEKLGSNILQMIKVSQHDFRERESHQELDPVKIGDLTVPVFVNRIALEADLLIGIGNIIPHPNAGYSGGAKILCPGCCGPETVSAMHTAAALLGYLPLGMKENACRDSLEQVAAAAGLNFIINVVLDADNQVIHLVTGDFIKAHRIGTELSKNVFGLAIPQEADILISCAFPYQDDYWQCEKAIISGYFAVKEGGVMILTAPCAEGLAHNHDEWIEWLSLDSRSVSREIRRIISPDYQPEADDKSDLVAASIAVGALTAKEKANIFIYTDGLSDEEIKRMGYTGFRNLQEAVDRALKMYPGGKIGILPRGGDCLPYLS